MFENLLLTREGATALVTINRPQVLNALNTATLHELRRATHELQQASDVRVVILTGSGEKAFVAGADIKELAGLRPVDAQQHAALGQDVFTAIEEMGKPVIAAVNGFALGGGCELAMACTLRLASERARFGQPEINLGILPGFGGTQRLPRLVGNGAALDIMLTGRMVEADEAFRLGLVNRVVPAANLLTEARALAALLAGKPPVAMRAIIDAVNRGTGMSLAQGQQLEAALFGMTASTADMREGTRAFVEKRPAIFKGE